MQKKFEPEMTRIILADGTDLDLSDAQGIYLTEAWLEVHYKNSLADPVPRSEYLSPIEWRRVLWPVDK